MIFNHLNSLLKSISKEIAKYPNETILLENKTIFVLHKSGKKELIIPADESSEAFPSFEFRLRDNVNKKSIYLLLKSFWQLDPTIAEQYLKTDNVIQKITITKNRLLLYISVLEVFSKSNNILINIFDNSDKSVRNFVSKGSGNIAPSQKDIVNLIKKTGYDVQKIDSIKSNTDKWAIAYIFRHIDTILFFNFLVNNFDEDEIIDIILARDRRVERNRSIIDSTYKKQLIAEYTSYINENKYKKEIDFLSRFYILLDISNISENTEKDHVKQFINFFRSHKFDLEKYEFSNKIENSIARIEKGKFLNKHYTAEIFNKNLKMLNDNERNILKIILKYFVDEKDKKLF